MLPHIHSCSRPYRREDLVLLLGLRARLEGDTELDEAIGAALDKFQFRGHVSVVGATGTDASVDDRAFRNLFYPLPASWRAGGSSRNGLLLVDMRANNKEVALASRQFEEEKKLIRGINEAMHVQQEHMLPDGSDNALAKEFGATRLGNVFYLRGFGAGRPWQDVHFAKGSIRLGSVAQFVFEFEDSSSPLKYLEESIAQGKAGDQGPPFGCKVDNGLTSQLFAMLTSNAEGNGNANGISGIKVLKGSHSMGQIRCVGLSVLVAINKHFTRFWMDIEASESEESVMAEAALSFFEEGVRYFYRHNVGYHLCSTKGAIVKAAMDPPYAFDICSYCGRLDRDEMPLKRCSSCSNARYCSTDCQARHWKMKGPNGHKTTCSRGGAEKKISVGSRVVISGLKSESGQKMNGKEGIVLAEANADGRVELILTSTLGRIEQGLVEQGKEITAGYKKLIKVQNIGLP